MNREPARADVRLYISAVILTTVAICVAFAVFRVTNNWAGNLLMFVPGLVAVVLLLRRREGLRSVGWRTGAPAAWAWAFSIPLGALAAWLSISWILGYVAPAAAGSQGGILAGQPLRLARNVLFYLAISLPLALGEELGWRGYLQNRLVRELGAFWGLLVLGLVWGFWHSPIFYVMGNYREHPLLGPFVMAPIDNVLATATMAWLYARSRSVWVPTFTHAFADVMWGFSGILFPPVAEVANWVVLQGVQLAITLLLWRKLRALLVLTPSMRQGAITSGSGRAACPS